MNRCEIRLKNETLAALNSYIVTRGVPLPPGAVRKPSQASVRDARGKVLASEGKISIRSMRLIVPTAMDPSATKLLRQSHHGHDWTHRHVEIAENVEVVASSVGDIDHNAAGFRGARHVVISVANNHVWWAYNKTEIVCCDGREAGMPLVNLAAAYRLTRDAKSIKAAKHIIKNFFLKWEKKYGTFKYPYPQGTHKRPHKLITGYGDWSSFAGLYRLWEATGDLSFLQFRRLGHHLFEAVPVSRTALRVRQLLRRVGGRRHDVVQVRHLASIHVRPVDVLPRAGLRRIRDTRRRRSHRGDSASRKHCELSHQQV